MIDQLKSRIAGYYGDFLCGDCSELTYLRKSFVMTDTYIQRMLMAPARKGDADDIAEATAILNTLLASYETVRKRTMC